MLFSILTIAKPNSENTIKKLRAEHRAYLEPRLPSVYLGGPLLGEDGESRIGGLMIMEFASREEAETYFSSQPYANAGIIEEILIYPFVPLVERGRMLDA